VHLAARNTRCLRWLILLTQPQIGARLAISNTRAAAIDARTNAPWVFVPLFVRG